MLKRNIVILSIQAVKAYDKTLVDTLICVRMIRLLSSKCGDVLACHFDEDVPL